MRLWVLPGQERALGLWQGRDATEMQSILESLPPGRLDGRADHAAHPDPSDPAIAPNRIFCATAFANVYHFGRHPDSAI